MSKPIRILIADNDEEFAGHLKVTLDKQEGTKVVDIVRDGQGTVNACRESLPDVVLIDLHLPVIDSVKTIQSLVNENEQLKILCISSIPNDRYAIEAVKAGASGYAEKNGAQGHEEILAAVQQLVSGEVVLNSALAAHILQEFT